MPTYLVRVRMIEDFDLTIEAESGEEAEELALDMDPETEGEFMGGSSGVSEVTEIAEERAEDA